MVLQDLGKKITDSIRKMSEAPIIDDEVWRSALLFSRLQLPLNMTDAIIVHLKC